MKALAIIATLAFCIYGILAARSVSQGVEDAANRRHAEIARVLS